MTWKTQAGISRSPTVTLDDDALVTARVGVNASTRLSCRSTTWTSAEGSDRVAGRLRWLTLVWGPRFFGPVCSRLTVIPLRCPERKLSRQDSEYIHLQTRRQRIRHRASVSRNAARSRCSSSIRGIDNSAVRRQIRNGSRQLTSALLVYDLPTSPVGRVDVFDGISEPAHRLWRRASRWSLSSQELSTQTPPAAPTNLRQTRIEKLIDGARSSSSGR